MGSPSCCRSGTGCATPNGRAPAGVARGDRRTGRPGAGRGGAGYEDWFVETAAAWVLPYLGDLVGYRPLPGYERVLAAGLRTAAARTPRGGGWPRRWPRGDVAATVGYRRRKGTLPLLEEMSASVAGWPARAAELSRLTAHHQPVRLYGTGGPGRTRGGPGTGGWRTSGTGGAGPGGRAVRLRGQVGGRAAGGVAPYAGRPLARRGGPVRVAAAAVSGDAGARVLRGPGPQPVHVLHPRQRHPLVTRPEPEPSAAHIATVDNVPAYIRRRQLADRPHDYYGPGKSLAVWRDGQDEPVPPSELVVADLSDWRYRPRRGQVAVDPALGRIAFGRATPAPGRVGELPLRVRGRPGRWEYPRDRVTPPAAAVYRVGPGGPYRQIMDAYRPGGTTGTRGGAGPRGSWRSRTAAPTRSSWTSTWSRATGSSCARRRARGR
ncbi:hypothetical protein NKH77_40020 [Streptomyces sp. M19]